MFTIKGTPLNQRQCDALIPLLNRSMRKPMSEDAFEKAAMEALEQAGCPLGYDAGIDPNAPLEQRVTSWARDGDTGLSSMSIMLHMQGVTTPDGINEGLNTGSPADIGDLSRCMKLLALVPEWRHRMGEMAGYGDTWAYLAPAWDQLEQTYMREQSSQPGATRAFPDTYDLMQRLSAEHANP